ncbi:hypothetical protein BB560_004245 [Smittium megazygosporum]|uniref:Cell division control protein 24 OB domain-containing protein n=3 Tax=Smittium megazygosporum TaxID=133381 RepID=A0A2T9Z9Q8_9FUNG|nr:hypothetical protein BB560_004245 [Smittium megazygosporum]
MIDVQTTIRRDVKLEFNETVKKKIILPTAKIVFVVSAINDTNSNLSVSSDLSKSRKSSSNNSGIINDSFSEASNKNPLIEHDRNFLLNTFGVLWNIEIKRFVLSERNNKLLHYVNQYWFYIVKIDLTCSNASSDDWAASGVNTFLSVRQPTSIFPTETKVSNLKKSKRIYGQVVNEFCEVFEVVLTLWGSDMKYIDLIAEGGYLGIWRAKVADDVSGSYEKKKILHIELNPDSIIFFQPPVGSSSRLMIRDLKPHVFNPIIVGTVIAVSDSRLPNMRPIILEDGSFHSRKVVKLKDESGVCFVTFWDELAIEASKLLPGQVIVLVGTRITFSNEKQFLNLSKKDNASFYVVNTIPGFLSSPDIHKVSYIQESYDKNLSYVYAFIRDIRPQRTNEMTSVIKALDFLCLVHNTCQVAVFVDNEDELNGVHFCEICGNNLSALNEFFKEFVIEFFVDDGSTCEWMSCSFEAAKSILGITPEIFIGLQNESQMLKALALPIGKEFAMCISSLDSEYNTSRCKFRIDCALLNRNTRARINNIIVRN